MASSSEQQNQWQVYLRLKGVKHLELYDVIDTNLICKIPNWSLFFKHANINDKITRQYAFTRIFEATSSQEEIFNNLAKPKLRDLINGVNSTFVTFGTSGAGKTFTLIGNSTNPGIIPRTLEELFNVFPNLSKYPRVKPEDNGEWRVLTDKEAKKERETFFNLILKKYKHLERFRTSYKKMKQALNKDSSHVTSSDVDDTRCLWVSFAEIFNEHIYDLLDCYNSNLKNRKKLTINKENGTPYIENLKNINVTSAFEAFEMLQFGLHNLNFLMTPINRYSNRSHLIFTIKFVQTHPKNNNKVSQMKFCDLLGPDYNKVIQNLGCNLIESNNNSLLVFSKCMREQLMQKATSYCDSTLTLLFQSAFTGNENVAMIVNINPTSEIFDETLQILNVSALAKTIIIEKTKADVGVGTTEPLNDQETRLKDIDGLFEVLKEATEQNMELHLNMQRELIRIVQYIEANVKDERKQTLLDYNTKDLQKLVENLRSFCVTTSGSQFMQSVNYDDLNTEEKKITNSRSLVALVSRVLDKIISEHELDEVEMIKKELDNIFPQNNGLKQSLKRVIEEHCKKTQESDAKVLKIMEKHNINIIESKDPNITKNLSSD